MKKLRIKVISSFLVVVFALVLTMGVTYAWWNMLTSTQNEQVELGAGDEIIVTENTSGTGKLIPDTQTPTGDEVTEVVFVYDVSVNEEAEEAGVTNLAVVAENILIDGDGTYSYLVNIDVTPSSTTLTTTSTQVTVTVTLQEPANETEYDAIVNKIITFDVVFTIS